MSDIETTEFDTMIDSMFKVGAHFGYSKSRRHPSMSPYIFGIKNRVEIFDLEKTKDLLQGVISFIETCGSERKKILLVSGKNEARDIIKNAAETIDMPYVAGRWIGGTFTNFSQIKKRIELLAELVEKREKGELGKFTKLERLHIDREIKDLDSTFGGLSSMKTLPQVLFVVDTKQETIAVEEAKKMGVTIVGLLNSDCDTKTADYYAVGNDASIASIKFFVDEVVKAYQEGLKKAPPQKESSQDEKQQKGSPKE